MNDKEQQIVDKLITDILAAGHAVSMWDNKAIAMQPPTKDKQEILERLDQTGADLLIVIDESGKELGEICLIYDDTDIIADCSTVLEPLLAGADALADSLK